jgi:hypothetical protein
MLEMGGELLMNDNGRESGEHQEKVMGPCRPYLLYESNERPVGSPLMKGLTVSPSPYCVTIIGLGTVQYGRGCKYWSRSHASG